MAGRWVLFGYEIGRAARNRRGNKRGKNLRKTPSRGGTASKRRDGAGRRKRQRRPTSGKRDRRPTSGKRERAGAAPPPVPGPPAVIRVLVMLIAFAAMVGFAVVLAKLTLAPSSASEPLTHSNLRPGDSIRDYLAQPAFRDTVKQIGGNILLGVPFGLLLPVLVPSARGLLRVGVATAVVMVLVELVQGALVTGRAFDIDDVILNTTGAFLGYLLLGRRLGRVVHPRRGHWWHRFTKRPATG
ncbi:VanZ family protein [Streptomyces sp. 8N706]|uniref:VanZ family protein n=1 Tax=Streptomyces sp. 8N706 TaxID=3457416 RepID=UPI003FD08CE2